MWSIVCKPPDHPNKCCCRRDANESLELAIEKQLQKDIKPPKHSNHDGLAQNHYNHPSFKAPNTPRAKQPISSSASRKRSHSSFPFLLITHITAPSNNPSSAQRLSSSGGLSVRSSSLEGRKRPPESTENSG